MSDIKTRLKEWYYKAYPEPHKLVDGEIELFNELVTSGAVFDIEHPQVLGRLVGHILNGDVVVESAYMVPEEVAELVMEGAGEAADDGVFVFQGAKSKDDTQ